MITLEGKHTHPLLGWGRGSFGAFRQTWRRHEGTGAPTVFHWLLSLVIAASLAMVNLLVILTAIDLCHTFSAFAPEHRASAIQRGHDIFALEQHLHIAL